jgi:hypothetical protein
MTTHKTAYLENAKLTSEFVPTKLTSTDALLRLPQNEVIKQAIKSVFFSFALILDLIVNLFTQIDFIKLDNRKFRFRRAGVFAHSEQDKKFNKQA